MLVCGADVLESFIKPGVWVEEQVRRILRDHGVVCIARCVLDYQKAILVSNLASVPYKDDGAAQLIRATTHDFILLACNSHPGLQTCYVALLLTQLLHSFCGHAFGCSHASATPEHICYTCLTIMRTGPLTAMVLSVTMACIDSDALGIAGTAKVWRSCCKNQGPFSVSSETTSTSLMTLPHQASAQHISDKNLDRYYLCCRHAVG